MKNDTQLEEEGVESTSDLPIVLIGKLDRVEVVVGYKVSNPRQTDPRGFQVGTLCGRQTAEPAGSTSRELVATGQPLFLRLRLSLHLSPVSD